MNRESFIAIPLALLVRIYLRLVRITVEDKAGIARRAVDEPLIWMFWHNRMLVIPVVYRRWLGRRRGSVLTSASKDGAIVARFMKCFGVSAIRGSSSRRGGVALLEMTREIRRGRDVAVTPDGPRGPRYRAGPGAFNLARNAGAPILPFEVRYSSFWELGTWDGFRIPKPFSRVKVIFHEPVAIDGPETEAHVVRLLHGGEES